MEDGITQTKLITAGWKSKYGK